MPSLRSRRKRGRGRKARTREKNGGLGPIFSPAFSLPFPFPVYACYAGYAMPDLSFFKAFTTDDFTSNRFTKKCYVKLATGKQIHIIITADCNDRNDQMHEKIPFQ